MQNLLKECQAGLNQATETFVITAGPAMSHNIGEMKKTDESMHKEMVQLIRTLSDTTTSSDRSSAQIFYGRDSELDNMMKMLSQQPARITILGGGGMAFFKKVSLPANFGQSGDSVGTNPVSDQVEEFLSLLTDLEHLVLIITMRGSERPAKVRWTHPFLLPLQPLSDEAAEQTFMDITDNLYS
ncbi:hypothetical protein B0H14DRAFT_3169421 [Mycena olivaceomarginata]|nr:hypothetical protein B0H14DRAFT_3169421 [Mycena olivaceomarginata]